MSFDHPPSGVDITDAAEAATHGPNTAEAPAEIRKLFGRRRRPRTEEEEERLRRYILERLAELIDRHQPRPPKRTEGLPPDKKQKLIDGDYEAGHEPGRRRAGTNMHSARAQRYVWLRFRSLMARDIRQGVRDPDAPVRSDDELLEEAYNDVVAENLTDEDYAVLEEWEATSVCEDEDPEADEDLRAGACLLDRVLGWLYVYAARRTGAAGRTAPRRLPVAGLFRMAATSIPKRIDWTRLHGWKGQVLAAWAYQWPHADVVANATENPASQRVVYNRAFHAVIAGLNRSLLEHVMVDAFRRLAELVTTDRDGNTLRVHPMAGLALVGDGSFTEASTDPLLPARGDTVHRALKLARGGRERAATRVYGTAGAITRQVFGYKLIVLVCVATGRPVIARLVGADADEAQVTLELLRRLRAIWPEHPCEYLVGDALYGHSLQFMRSLLFEEGIVPVFPWRSDYREDAGRSQVSGRRKTAVSKYRRGVPCCKHGPMKLKQWQGTFWSAKARRAGQTRNGTPVGPRGVVQPDAEELKLAFECPTGGCKSTNPKHAHLPEHERPVLRAYTTPWEHPNIFSPLPWVAANDSGPYARRRDTALRRVLLLRRNVVESVYAAIQSRGLQGRGTGRPQWCRDDEMEILLMLALTFLTVRRLVADNGTYDYAKREAKRAGALRIPDPARPYAGTTGEHLRELLVRRAAILGPLRPPQSWLDELGLDAPPELDGSAAFDLLTYTPPEDDDDDDAPALTAA